MMRTLDGHSRLEPSRFLSPPTWLGVTSRSLPTPELKENVAHDRG